MFQIILISIIFKLFLLDSFGKTVLSLKPIHRDINKINLEDNHRRKDLFKISFKKEDLQRDLKKFFQIFSDLMASKKANIYFYHKIKNTLKDQKPLSSKELRSLQLYIINNLTLRDQMLKYVEKYSFSMRAFDRTNKEQLKGVLLMLASALFLLDNYAQNQKLYLKNDRVRHIINDSFFKNKNQETNFIERILKFKNLTFVFKKIYAITFIHSKSQIIKNHCKNDPIIQKLMNIIKSSQSYQTYKNLPKTPIFNDVFNSFKEISWLYQLRTSDQLHETISAITYSLNKILMNAFGSIVWRKGLLKKDKKWSKKVKKILRPMDILLEKSPFRLTDHLLEGFWSHVGLWVGDREQLKELNLWDHSLVKPYHSQIIKGKGVLEALRSGVQLNTIDQFMNIDTLAVLRPRQLTKKEMKEGILLALNQLGKKYDFNFNLETQKTIVCSELIYIAFFNIDWNAMSRFGRFNLIPDDIARQALRGGSFDLKFLIYQGSEYSHLNRKKNIFKKLLY